jgi:hypothetical protein
MLPGGVCAVLDYEVPQMTDYVSEMTQRLCNPDKAVSADFRKFVSGLLSSTRLPSTTILLGMNYLSRRVNELSGGVTGVFTPTEGETWRLLTIGLLLGSKFLDDNTFQNRSWSEVSGIPVKELNVLESAWLSDIKWNLYVNLDKSKDFKAWIENWNAWREIKNIRRNATLDRLAPLSPIDTNVQRVHPYPTSHVIARYAKTTSSRDTSAGYYSGYEGWNPYQTPCLTPPSASDSGLNTPEYASITGHKYNDWAMYNQYSRAYQQPPHHVAYAHAPQPRVAPYHTPFSNHYGHHYGSNHWDSAVGVENCGGPCCNPQQIKQPYFASHAYGHQIAA